VVLAAVAQSGWALEYASKELRRDREVALTAVAQKGSALKCVPEELKADREVVLRAIAQDGQALKYAGSTFSQELLGDLPHAPSPQEVAARAARKLDIVQAISTSTSAGHALLLPSLASSSRRGVPMCFGLDKDLDDDAASNAASSHAKVSANDADAHAAMTRMASTPASTSCSAGALSRSGSAVFSGSTSRASSRSGGRVSRARSEDRRFEAESTDRDEVRSEGPPSPTRLPSTMSGFRGFTRSASMPRFVSYHPSAARKLRMNSRRQSHC